MTRVLQSGYEISRHLSASAHKAQLGSDFPLKRVPTILTIERREKRKKKERLAGRGLPSPRLPVALGERTGAVSRTDQIFPLSLLNGFLNVCPKQEPADKVHRRGPPTGRYQRKMRSFVRPGLSCPVTDASEYPRRETKGRKHAGPKCALYIHPPFHSRNETCRLNALGRGW